MAMPAAAKRRQRDGIRQSRLACCRLAQSRLCGGKARDWNAEWRARHIVEPHLMAEHDRRRVTPVLAADPELHVGACLAATLDGNAHEFAHAVRIERDERIDLDDALLGI